VTVSKKVVGGLSLVLVMAAAALAVVYRGLTRVEHELHQLAAVKEPSYSSTLEIEVNLNGIVLAVFAYIRERDPQYRALVLEDERDVADFHARYLGLAEAAEERRLAVDLGTLFEEFRLLGRELMDLRDSQEGAFTRVADQLERADSVIDLISPPLAARTDLAAALKLSAVSDLEAELAEVGFWLVNYQRGHTAELKRSIAVHADQVRAALVRCRGLTLSPKEADQLNAVEHLFEGAMDTVEEAIASEDDLRGGTKRFLDLRARMDGLLDERIQPIALARLYQPRRAADQAVTSVIERSRWLMPAVLIAAALVAAAVITAISRPLRRLKAGTEAVGAGDLDHRIVITSRDEFADVAAEFNRMVEQLQATTVSKEALERSELILRRTVAQLRREIAERERAEASLRRAETMAAMGALVAGVAHEVRNPLFGILSILDAVEARFAERTDQQRHFTALREEAGRLNALMQDLLEYGKPPRRELAPGSLQQVLGEALRRAEPVAAEAGVRLLDDIPPDIAPVRLDRERLLRVFQNLLENAIQHSQAGASVVLKSRTGGSDGDRWVECVVADAGPGLRPEDLPHLFEPFFTRRPGGTGLGLSIVQQIAEEHGGQIVAANRPEGGAMMTVRLPVCDAEAAAEVSPARP
jgi:signal transduction histidine kinase